MSNRSRVPQFLVSKGELGLGEGTTYAYTREQGDKTHLSNKVKEEALDADPFADEKTHGNRGVEVGA